MPFGMTLSAFSGENLPSSERSPIEAKLCDLLLEGHPAEQFLNIDVSSIAFLLYLGEKVEKFLQARVFYAQCQGDI